MSDLKTRLCVLALTGCLALPVAQSLAQDPGPAANEQASQPANHGGTSIWGILKQGGVIMFPLGALSIAALGLAIYGGIATQEKKMLPMNLIPALQEDLERLHIDNAKTTCANNPSLLTNTLSAGLDRLSDGVLDAESMEKAMEEASVHEITTGMKPINYLSIIAQIAPMLGLLGTVSGMIKAFDKIGMGGMGKPELLAADIGEAMVTTATGLIIAIPTMFLYFFLKGKYMSNVSQLNRILGNLAHELVSSARRRGDR
jgi:biopolymer transport protein ExbB